jgi:hypothetical protein
MTLATHGTIGQPTIPACSHCGGFTVRVDGQLRKCEACNKLSKVTIGFNEWDIHPYQKPGLLIP